VPWEDIMREERSCRRFYALTERNNQRADEIISGVSSEEYTVSPTG